MAKLTPKQAEFCRQYVVDRNATQAAIRAGYSENTAGAIGSENLKKPEIATEVRRLSNERAKSVEITAEYVLNGIAEVFEETRAGTKGDRRVFLKSAELLGKRLQLFVDRVENVDLNSLNDFATQFVQIALRHVSDPDERRAILADLDAMGAGDA